MHKLPQEIGERLGHYVYILLDPATGQPFYVGKGTGARLLAHGVEAERLSEGRGEPEKVARIRRIRADGKEPVIDVVRYGLSEPEALTVEAALIDCLPGLTNRVRGAGTESGRIALLELITQFGAAPLGTPSVPALLIKLRNWHLGSIPPIPDRVGGGYRPGVTEKELYDATRGWWKLSPDRVVAAGINHAVAVHRGVTRAVYRIDHWFRDAPSGRCWFEGVLISSGQVFDDYVGPFGRRVAFSKGAQNPIAYLTVDPSGSAAVQEDPWLAPLERAQ